MKTAIKKKIESLSTLGLDQNEINEILDGQEILDQYQEIQIWKK